MSFATKDGSWIEGDDITEFVTPYSYYINPIAEEFLQSLRVRLSKDHSHIKVYISTANPYNHWLYDLYRKDNANETSI